MEKVPVIYFSALHRLADAVQLLKTATPHRVINGVCLGLSLFISKIFHRVWHWGNPAAISIETSAFCNLKCPECSVGSNSLTRPAGLMNSSLFDRIINESQSYACWVNLYFQGEPFLHPGIFEFIQSARKKKMYTCLSTNGQFLDKEHSAKIIKSGLNRIIISLDGADTTTYASYRINGDFSKVTSGIRNLVQARSALGVKHPYIIVQFLLFRHNEHQASAMRNLVAGLGADTLQFKTAQLLNPLHPGKMLPPEKNCSRYYQSGSGFRTHIKPGKVCYRIWDKVVITWDGKVLPCCFDKDACWAFGTIGNETIEYIWKNRTANEFRKNVWSIPSRIPICLNCDEKMLID